MTSTLVVGTVLYLLGLWFGYVFGVDRATTKDDLDDLDIEDLELVGRGCPDCHRSSTAVLRGYLVNRGYCPECGRAGAQDPPTALLRNARHYLRSASDRLADRIERRMGSR